MMRRIGSVRVGKWFAVLWALLLSSSGLLGHVVDQFYIELDAEKKALVVNFDVGYAIADTRDDPDEPAPLRDWLVSRSEAQHLVLRAEAERYLRSSIQFKSGDKSVGYEVSFPDFDVEPYAFPKLLNNGAYYNVMLKPDVWDASLTVVNANKDFPNLVLAFRERESGEIGFSTVEPTKGFTIGAGAVVSEKLGSDNELKSISVIELLKLGFRHVIPDGWDHILFILGLCLMAVGVKNMLWQSLAFTFAHSVSMGLVITGVLPIYTFSVAFLIEPIIALSITLIAFEGLRKHGSMKWRFALITLFGAVHGLGFAGSLGSKLQFVAADNWLMPLVVSNLGIEVAQAILVVCGFGMLALISMRCGQTAGRVVRMVSAVVIGSVGLLWFFERIL